MGDEKQQQLSLRGLQNAAGFLQSKIASRIESRHTPRLRFVIDTGVQNSLRVGEILEQIKRERREAEAAAGVAPGNADGEQVDSSPPPADSPPADPPPADPHPADPHPADSGQPPNDPTP
jgi:ribosome-binding factor A